ncbi:hypothetical protein D8674_009722 [Pyrus ussuriensis x Pyrus communis]|uniref:Uncharacterized protein n=1 Tax=Pyrus ussuriensis x Pyrus communis TaxID=2448454 RepID=A0A5N5FC66_9ROSA|nr:hypothetical protein D8674_009722 [Pyrus ussuriensis x Pyrus communis]
MISQGWRGSYWTRERQNFSEVVENLVTIEKLTEDLKKAKHMTELEIEEKNKRIVDLDKETSAMFTENRQAEELQIFKHYWKQTKLDNFKLGTIQTTKISHHE